MTPSLYMIKNSVLYETVQYQGESMYIIFDLKKNIGKLDDAA